MIGPEVKACAHGTLRASNDIVINQKSKAPELAVVTGTFSNYSFVMVSSCFTFFPFIIQRTSSHFQQKTGFQLSIVGQLKIVTISIGILQNFNRYQSQMNVTEYDRGSMLSIFLFFFCSSNLLLTQKSGVGKEGN